MSAIQTNQNLKQIAFAGVVTRCGCGEPASHPDAPCPQGIVLPPRTLCYYHKNFAKRWAYALLCRVFGPARAFWLK